MNLLKNMYNICLLSLRLTPQININSKKAANVSTSVSVNAVLFLHLLVSLCLCICCDLVMLFICKPY